MADTTFRTVLPALKAVDLGDGTYAMGVNVRGGVYATGRTATYVVAASNAPATWLTQSDYVMPNAGADLGAVINAAIALGYKVITTSEGIFSVTTTILLNDGGIILRGQGIRGRWELANNANVDMIQITESQVVLEYLELRGNNANNITSSGIVLKTNAVDTRIFNTRIMDFNDYGIELQGGGACYALNLLMVDVEGNGSHGIYLHGGGGHTLNHVISHGNVGKGIWLANNAATESKLTNMDVDSNGTDGIQLDTGTRCTLTGWKAMNNGNVGLRVTTMTQTSIVGGNSDDNITVGGWEQVLFSGCTSITFTGNTIVKSASGGGRVGLYILNTTYSTFSANAIDVDATRCIELDGTTINNSFIGNTVATAANRFYFNSTQQRDNLIFGNIGFIAPGEIRTASGSLTAGIANAFTLAWQNPEAQAVMAELTVDITTAGGTATSVLDAGSAADATTHSDNMIDGADLNATNTIISLARVKLAANGGATDWITGQILIANASSLVGKYYIKYTGV